MTARRILTFIVTAVAIAEAAKIPSNQKRNAICDPMYDFNNSSKVQCYCGKDAKDADIIRTAECFLALQDVTPTDPTWNLFEPLKNTLQLTFTNNRGIHLTYVPTKALTYTQSVLRLEIKYSNIEKIPKFAFANSSTVEEMYLRDNKIKILEPYAFAHLKELAELNLDQNNIVEINRDVFVDLPSLEKIFFTSNKITTIHDKAFMHLTDLRELELYMNKIFSLNSETFYGLSKLLRLDLSNNKLEVLGQNTFLPLKSLEVLNLDENMIQMIDDGAFNGLKRLKTLSLAHNKLTSLESPDLFQGLISLSSLGLKSNQLIEIKPEAMEPILPNFYGSDASLDVDDNNFACDCRLDWFMDLMNQTDSKNLKIALENLKCNPDARQREAWTNLEEQDKANGQVFDDTLETDKNTEYEYYDESQLNGKLFYTDLRLHLIKCPKKNTGNVDAYEIDSKSQIVPQDLPVSNERKINQEKLSVPTLKPPLAPTKAFKSHGILDLSQYDTTTKEESDDTIDRNELVNPETKKSNAVTTTRLATVSAKTIDEGESYNSLYEGMASDEAKPEMKAHRSVAFSDKVTGASTRNLGCVALVSTILFVRLFH